MAELSLKQITDRLNEEFTGDTRKLVFWYDEKVEFEGDVAEMQLENAKIWRLEPNNQFYTKQFLEREDPKTNYLIYAPFPKPDVSENHLEDTYLYSKAFHADRASIVAADLGIDESLKNAIAGHIQFFSEKSRLKRFESLRIETWSEQNLLLGMMAVLSGAHTASFEEVVRSVLSEGDLNENRLLSDFEKYNLLDAFWKLCKQSFGYEDAQPDLERLVISLFVTMASRTIQAAAPPAWRAFRAYKEGNVVSFLDNMMHSDKYQKRFDELSDHAARNLRARELLSEYSPETLTDCETFRCIDEILLKWLTDRLMSEDVGAKLSDLSIPEVCESRSKTHFGSQQRNAYQLLQNAYTLISCANYECPEELRAIVRQYEESDYRIDTAYRRFYEAYDALEDTAPFETLRELIENIYTNEYLGVLLPRWNVALSADPAPIGIPMQMDFFSKYIRSTRDRVAVIISDALRYEVGAELFRRLSDSHKSGACQLDGQLSVLPSYTRLGMAALLPHRTVSMSDDYRVQVDGSPCDNLENRAKILKTYLSKSACVQFDAIKSLKKTELRDIFTGKDVVYIYHNQIDARGDKANTEDEVFQACEEAVQEIFDLIHKLASSANTIHFIVTADHGFLYKRDKVSESHKIAAAEDGSAFVNRRFVISGEPISGEGIASVRLGEILRNADEKIVSFPVGSSVFKAPGGGQNYVHGGSSPQEMIVPVIDVRMQKARVAMKNAQIVLVSILKKITNKMTKLKFMQTEAVSDTVKAAAYRIYFASDDKEKISSDVIHIADSRDPEPDKRSFPLTFQFRDQKYDRDGQYFLVIEDAETGMEIFRQPVIIDLAFTDDFGF